MYFSIYSFYFQLCSIKIMPKAIVCAEAVLRGDITISSGCIIHPSATIIAEAGPIILGENCLVEEYVTIAHRLRPANSEPEKSGDNILSIGCSNIFEVGCTVESNRIGDKNVFECKCYVGPQVSVSNGCVIGAGIKVNSNQQLIENTVIYSKDLLQRKAIDRHIVRFIIEFIHYTILYYLYYYLLGCFQTPTLQIDFLRKVLPNYHHVHKSNYDPKRGRVAY